MLDPTLIPSSEMSFWNFDPQAHQSHVYHQSSHQCICRKIPGLLSSFIALLLHLLFRRGIRFLLKSLSWKIIRWLLFYVVGDNPGWNEFRLGIIGTGISFLQMIAYLFRKLGIPCLQALFFWQYQHLKIFWLLPRPEELFCLHFNPHGYYEYKADFWTYQVFHRIFSSSQNLPHWYYYRSHTSILFAFSCHSCYPTFYLPLFTLITSIIFIEFLTLILISYQL